MNANILCTLLAQRIPPEQFQIHGEEVVFFDPEKNNKPIDSPNESPYDTPENRAIVEDVIKNYDALEAEYLAKQAKERAAVETKTKLVEIDLKSIQSIREWIAKQPDADQYTKELKTQAIFERAKI